MLHECTGTFLTVTPPATPYSYNYVLNDPNLVISLTGATPYIVENGVYSQLTTNSILCFEYSLYESDPAGLTTATSATLPAFIVYSYPTVTLTTPGPNAIGSASNWSKKYWLGARVKIDGQTFVSQPFTINIVHECSKASIDSVVPSFPVEHIDLKTATKQTFSLFTTTEVSTTTCIMYKWQIKDAYGVYVTADSTTASILSTIGYPSIEIAATYTPTVP
jgi:hypothetical protein